MLKRLHTKKIQRTFRLALIVVMICMISQLDSAYIEKQDQENKGIVVTLTAAGDSSDDTAPLPSRRADILSAMQKNPDTIGWLAVPGTTLDMPVVQTKNNSYYLKHNFNKQNYKKGWPFLDFRDKTQDLSANTVIYGHNVGDGTLFGQLLLYRDLKFFNKNAIIYFGTATQDYYWKVFAEYVTDVKFDYIQTNFSSDYAYGSLLGKIKSQSLVSPSFGVSTGDKILTLSTCCYDFTDARFVVQAKLVNPGESYSSSAATQNPSPASPHH